jgi:hypothetical protein
MERNARKNLKILKKNQSKWLMVATNELLCLKNAGAQISMFSTLNEKSAPMAIKKKSKSWGPFWIYQLNSTANSAHLAHF